MTIRRAAILAAFGALGAFAANPAIAPTVLPSSAGCTQPSNTVACGSIGTGYIADLTVTNPPAGGGTAVWSFSAGVQPPGLGIASGGLNSAAITGTPTQAGLYTFTIAATYATMPSTVVTAQFSIAIAGPKLTIVAPLSLASATAGTAISATVFTATGGIPFIDSMGNAFYHWSIVPGQGSQSDGLVMDQNSGTLSGTPLNAGIFSITIGVLDAVGTAAIHIYTLNVSGSNSLTITTTSLPGGIINQAYSQKLTETGGPVPGVTWSIVSGSGNLPPGLNISSNTDSTGMIAGTPTAAGVYNFTVQASYQVTNLGSVQVVTGTAALSITITTQLTMANPAAVSGVVSQMVTMQFTVVNGTAPYTYALQSGTVPPGTSLNAQTGAVAGQVTTAGAFTFTIQVTDAVKQTATAQGTITIAAVTLSATVTLTGSTAAASQPTVTLTLATAPGVALTGNLKLKFVRADNAISSEVRFSSGSSVCPTDSTSTCVPFTVAAGATQAVLPTGLAVITGTVAGTGTIQASFTDALGNDITPKPAPAATFTIVAQGATAVPVITSFAIACTGPTTTAAAFYTATIVGYSTTLDMTSVTFNFKATTGTTLTTPSLTVPLPTAGTCSSPASCPSLPAWWSSSNAAQTGSQFALTVQLNFTVTGGASTNPIDTATVAATNSAGNSTTTASTAVSPPCP